MNLGGEDIWVGDEQKRASPPGADLGKLTITKSQ